MSEIEMNACAQLVRMIADELASTGLATDREADVGDLITHVRGLSEAAEVRMPDALLKLHPGIGWIGEEARPDIADYWLYDPIDGAYHYLQGLPLWSSSLVLVRGGEAVTSIVYDPAQRELFVARRGHGATCNGSPVLASRKTTLAAAVVGGAVPPLAQVGEAEQSEALALLGTVARSVFVVRPMAAVSLQLAYVAAGRLDGYFENGHDAADWLAGALLVREAGGVVTDLSGAQFGWLGEGIVAGGGGVQPKLLAAIEADLRPAMKSAASLA